MEETNYLLEIYQTDAVCNVAVIGHYWVSWFSGEAGLINLRDFFGFSVPGVYRVKLAVQNDCTDWDEMVQCVTVLGGDDCNENGVPDECEVLDHTYIGGEDDDFLPPQEQAQPGPELQDVLDDFALGTSDFDDDSGDKMFGHTFYGLPEQITDIELEIHLVLLEFVS